MLEDVRKGWAQLLIFIGLALFGTASAAAPLSIRQLGAEQLRLATAGYRVGAANARTCAQPQMLSGLVLHDLTQYQPTLRPAVSSAFSLHGGFGVLEVVPGSVAAKAGLRIDDEILRLDGASVDDPNAARTSRQSYQRLGRFSDALSAALRAGDVDLLVRRRGQLLHTTLQGEPACGGDTLVINASDLNAWSDGRHVFVSTGMMRLAETDDQLAFVVGHEMAHNMLGHASENEAHGLLSLFGLGSARIRREETAADALAVPLMSAAGYQATAAIDVLQHARSALWWAVSLDHPGFGQRIKAVTSIIAGQA